MMLTRVAAALLGWIVALSAPACSSGPAAECKSDNDCPSGRYCKAGRCAYDCTYDSDCTPTFRCGVHGQCEAGCVKTNHGVELCDGIDNDCDSLTDEDFPDLGKPCQNGGCPPGVYSCKKDGSGVECNGSVPAADDSTCDGIDDDCDGSTDEDALPKPCPLQQGVCAGAMSHCVNGAWSDCEKEYGANYTRDEDKSCDGLDNDCDGSTDENAAPQPVGEIGAQAKDGKDNNCNGLVDEPGGVLVKVSDQLGIDAYEVSVFDNPDCTGHQYGVASDDYPAGFPKEGTATVTLYSCSLPGILPSGYLSWYRAKWACESQGKRLCAYAEFDLACAGPEGNIYPYGSTFMPLFCNLGLQPPQALAPAGSYPQCLSGFGVADMSGNLTEWIADWNTDYPGTAKVGGSNFLGELCSQGLNCASGSPGDQNYIYRLKQAADCIPGSDQEESYPRNDARNYLGTRCCWDVP